MAEALYGGDGFYVAAGAPGRHFRTAAHASPAWAAAMTGLAAHVEESLGFPETFTVVDVGAGGGELLAGLAARAPRRWALAGVDVAPRPDTLPDRVDWLSDPPDGITGLLLAVELLDVVPVDVVELTEAGPRLVEVSSSGDERLAGPPPESDLAWLDRWWPLVDTGDRAEVGTPRDRLWSALAATVHRGVAIAVDYAAVPARDVAGTLTGYRDGRQVRPVPDGGCDLTAHVRFESLRGPDDQLVAQREALRRLGVDGRRPAYTGDAASYLTQLSAAGESAELLDPAGLGGFSWLLHAVDVPQPLVTR
jgi:SAM-dependent MidA family methyltransferase